MLGKISVRVQRDEGVDQRVGWSRERGKAYTLGGHRLIAGDVRAELALLGAVRVGIA